MKLNLGCQIHAFEGWTNQDIVGDDPNIKADLVCDAAKLPLEDNSVNFIYAGHLVEHYYPDTLPDAIKEWYRVLKPNGKLVIVTPDCGAVYRDYASGKLNIEETWQQTYGRIYHYDAPSERHHIAFDWITLKVFAANEFWSGCEQLDFNNPPEELKPQMDVHISRGAYQLGVVLTK
jgi:predicted SAM-dependent methyltransferase